MTILFWCIAAGMLILALLFVLPPLLRRAAPASAEAAGQLNVTVHRARLAELEEQLALGSLSEEQFRLARDELQRALLTDASTPAPLARRRSSAHGWVVAGVVALAVPLASVVIYQSVGSKRALSIPSPEPQTQTGVPSEQSVETMVESLQRRLEREPDDADGWLLLARSYTVLERHQEALAAYGRARALVGDNAQLLVEYAQALAEHQGGQLRGQPAELLERAVTLEPTHQRARWLAGFAALQSGQSDRALMHWQVLLAELPPDSDEARMIREISARVTSAQAPEVADGGARGIDVRVSLGGALSSETDPRDVVFVFARAVDGASRAPLAIARLRVGDLPRTVRLDDSLSMIPGRKLSDFEEVIVGARVSRTGQPIAQPGDLEGFSEPVPVAVSGSVEIVISSRIPGND